MVFHSSGNDLTKQSPFQILRAIHFWVLPLVTEPSIFLLNILDWWWEIIRQSHKINRRKKSKNNQKRYKTTQCRMGILYSLIWGEMRLKSEKTVNDFLWCEFLNEGVEIFYLFIFLLFYRISYKKIIYLSNKKKHFIKTHLIKATKINLHLLIIKNNKRFIYVYMFIKIK